MRGGQQEEIEEKTACDPIGPKTGGVWTANIEEKKQIWGDWG